VKIESLVFSNVVTNAWQYEQIKKPTKKKQHRLKLLVTSKLHRLHASHFIRKLQCTMLVVTMKIIFSMPLLLHKQE